MIQKWANLWVDVKQDFDAKGDGISDDSTLIQNAINSLGITGGTVFFPIGTYMCSMIKVPNNVHLLGVFGLSRLKLLPGLPDGSWVIQNTNFTSGNSNIYLDSIVLDGNASAYPIDINVTTTQFQKVTGLYLKDTIITGGLADGLYAYNCSKVTVINSDFSNNGRFQVDGSGLNIDTCDTVNLLGIVSNGNGFHGMLVSGTTNLKVSGTFNNNGYDGVRSQYSANHNEFRITCSNNTQRGIYFTTACTFNSLMGCKLYSNHFHGAVFNGSSNNTLMGCTITGNSMNGIVTVVNTDTQKGTGNIITGNTSGDLSLASASNFPVQ